VKNNFKRILAFVLGFLMFLFSAPRASAQIEVVEFSDESRLIRFTKNDLQNMVDWYAWRKRQVATLKVDDGCDSCGIFCFLFCELSALHACIPLIACGCADGVKPALFVPGILLLVVAVVAPFGFCYYTKGDNEAIKELRRVSAKPGESWLGPQDVLNILVRQNVAVGASESQPLLRGGMQGAPGYFLLFVRSKAKSEFDPKPFFTTDQDARFAQSLRNNRFAGLIRDVGGKLRARGARITKRYYLSKVGSGFAETSDPRVMHEIDSVDVVVDDADEDAA